MQCTLLEHWQQLHRRGGLGEEDCWEKYLEPEHPLDEGTEWVVGCSTEMVDSSPSTQSMYSWPAAPSTKKVDFSLS